MTKQFGPSKDFPPLTEPSSKPMFKYNLPASEGSFTFIELEDTPSSYTGYALCVPIVNTGENRLDFISFSHSSLFDTHNLTDDIDHNLLFNYVAAEHIRWDLTGAEQIHLDRLDLSGLSHADDDFYNQLTLTGAVEDTDQLLIADASDSFNYKRITKASLVESLGTIQNAYYRIIPDTGLGDINAIGEDTIYIQGDGNIIQTYGINDGANKLSLVFRDQSSNRFLGGPPSGLSDIPIFRALIDADMPTGYNAAQWDTAYLHVSDTGNPHGTTFDDIGTLSHSDLTGLDQDDHALVYEKLLGNPTVDGYILSSTIAGVRSWIQKGDNYSFISSIQESAGNVSLVGDSAAPGASRLYGTNASGTKGWYTIPSDIYLMNQGDNRILTSTSTSNVISAESNLTFDSATGLNMSASFNMIGTFTNQGLIRCSQFQGYTSAMNFGPYTAGTIYFQPSGWGNNANETYFNTTLANIGTNARVNDNLTVVGKTTTSTIQISTGATDGYYLRSDSLGNGTWAAVSASQVYKGTWDASTNTPTLADGTGTTGWYYRVTVAGTVNLGSGNITFEVGDDVMYNSSNVWERIPAAIITGAALTKGVDDDNVIITLSAGASTALLNAVTITADWTGTLADSRIASASDWNDAHAHSLITTGNPHSISLTDLTDSTIISIASGEILKWSGTAWINNTLAEANIAAADHEHAWADITSGVPTDITNMALYDTDDLAEGLTNLYYTEVRVDANTNVAANTAARHAAVTIGTANGLSLTGQALSLGLAGTASTGALSSTHWNTFNDKVSFPGFSTLFADYGYTEPTHAFSEIASKPTTLTGYGITDAVPSARTITINGNTQSLAANTTWTIADTNYYLSGVTGSGSGTVTFARSGGLANLTWNAAHSHGYIDQYGSISTTKVISSGDRLLLSSEDDGYDILSSTIAFNTLNSTYFLSQDGTWRIPAGGTGTIGGTGSNDQIAVWVNGTTLEGTAGLTFNGSVLAVPGGITVDNTFISTSGDIIASRDGIAKIEIIATNAVGAGIIGTDTDHDLLLRRYNSERARLTTTGVDITGDLAVSGNINSSIIAVSSSSSTAYGLTITQSTYGGQGIRTNLESGDPSHNHIACYNHVDAQVAHLDASGDWYAGDFAFQSDPRLKDVEDTPVNGLEIALALNPVFYKWKDRRNDFQHLGFLTTEVEKVRPELVKKGGKYDSLSYTRITAINTAAIHGLNDKIETLEMRQAKKIAELENRIKELEDAAT